jgi:hypothetical protein
MITAVTNVQRLDWDGWFRGLIGAFLSGGAGAVSSGLGANYLDKAHDLNIFKLMGITFLISATFSLAKFLQTQPVPQLEGEKT